jgi:hypothetical protein
VVESRCAIELGDDRRQLRAEPPLVCTASGCLKRLAPAVPPGRHRARKRLDDEHAIALRNPMEQAPKHQLAGLLRQLVQDERREKQRPLRRQRDRREVILPGARADDEVAVRARGLGQRPRVPIDADNVWTRGTGCRPCGSRRAGPTSEIDEHARAAARVRQGADDVAYEEVVEGSVKHRERRAFSRPRQRRTLCQLRPALDVRRRERSQRTRHLGERQIREVARFERGHPLVKPVTHGRRTSYACSVD